MKNILYLFAFILVLSGCGNTTNNETSSKEVDLQPATSSDNTKDKTKSSTSSNALTKPNASPSGTRQNAQIQRPDPKLITASIKLRSMGLSPVTFQNWHYSYTAGSRLNENDPAVVTKSEVDVWKGINENNEIIDIRLSKVSVTEIVLQKSKKENNANPSIKISKFKFENEKSASDNLSNLEKISKYILNTNGLKNPNWIWQHEESIYLFQTSAVAFEGFAKQTIAKFKKIIKKK